MRISDWSSDVCSSDYGSLYDDGAYGVPNGNSLPYVLAAQSVSQLGFVLVNVRPRAPVITLIDRGLDTYAGVTQSRNLRDVDTSYDPTFRAKNVIYQLHDMLAFTTSLLLFSHHDYHTGRACYR